MAERSSAVSEANGMSRGPQLAQLRRAIKDREAVTPMALAWWAKIWISAKQVIPSAQNSRTRLQRSCSRRTGWRFGCADR